MPVSAGTSLIGTVLMGDGADASSRLGARATPGSSFTNMATLTMGAGSASEHVVRLDGCLYTEGATDYEWRIVRDTSTILDTQVSPAAQRGTASHPVRFTVVDRHTVQGRSYTYRLQARNPVQPLTVSQGNLRLPTRNNLPTSGTLNAAAGGTAPYSYDVLRASDGGSTAGSGVSVSGRTVTVAAGRNISLSVYVEVTDSAGRTARSGTFVLSADTRRVVTTRAPGAPTGLRTSNIGSNQVTLTCSAPSDLGVPALTGYIWQWRAPGEQWSSARQRGSGSNRRSVTVASLRTSTRYEFRVAATNGQQTGSWSSTVSATTFPALVWSQQTLVIRGSGAAASGTLATPTGGGGNYSFFVDAPVDDDFNPDLPAGVSLADDFITSGRILVAANRGPGAFSMTVSVLAGTATQVTGTFTVNYNTQNVLAGANVSVSIAGATSATTGDTVTLTANAAGDYDSIAYQWSGAASGTGRTATVRRTTAGTATATVRATVQGSGTRARSGTTASDTDSHSVVFAATVPAAQAGSVSIAGATSAAPGDTVTLTAAISGGRYDAVDYQWGGAASGTGRTATVRRTAAGTATATLSVTFRGTGTRARSGTSAVSDATPRTVVFTVASRPPGAVTAVAFSRVSGTGFRATATAPAAGTSAITGYEWQRRVGTGARTSSSSTGTVEDFSGLTPGVTYRVRVRARSADGDGPWSGEFTQATTAFTVTQGNLTLPTRNNAETSGTFAAASGGRAPVTYVLRLASDDSDASGQQGVSVSGRTVTVAAGRNISLTVYIEATDADGSTARSGSFVLSADTRRTAQAPGRPPSISFSRLDTDRFYATARAPTAGTSPITGYRWQWKSGSQTFGAADRTVLTPVTNPEHLYAIDASDLGLWRINASSPASSTRVGALPGALSNPRGLASHNGVLHAYDINSDTLWGMNVEVPRLSGAYGATPNAASSFRALASHGGTLYGAYRGALYRIPDINDPSTAAAVGDFPDDLDDPTAMASHGGALYCVSGRDLWTINTSSPGRSSLAAGGFSRIPQAITGMASFGGSLYGLAGFVGELYLINVSSPRSSTKVGDLPAGLQGVNGPSGLAAHRIPPFPLGQHEFRGLTLNTSYDVRAQAISDDGTGSWSAAASQRTLANPLVIMQEDISLRRDGRAITSEPLSTATGGDGTTILYEIRSASGGSLPAGVTIDADARTITVAAGQRGSVELAITAFQSAKITSAVFTLTYNTTVVYIPYIPPTTRWSCRTTETVVEESDGSILDVDYFSFTSKTNRSGTQVDRYFGQVITYVTYCLPD